MRKKLILVVSERMDTNKKGDRNENSLVRMSSITREYMGFHDDHVELWPVGSTGEERLTKSLSLKIFHAFNNDIKKLKRDIRSGQITNEGYKRVGFVTTRTFNRICGDNKTQSDNIWISDDIYDTVMGADPEFLLFNDRGKVVHAWNVLPHIGEIGSDGAMAEVRPHPEVSINKLVKNMEKIFRDNVDRDEIKNYKLVATCYHENDERGYPVGGHIHIGNPIQLVKKSNAVKNGFYKVTNKIIDEYLTVPLIKLDGPKGAKRRSKDKLHSGFGHFGDFRTDHGRLEHRSLSGIWLLHPSVSRAVLGTTKAITDEVLRLISDHQFKEEYILPGNKFGNTNLYDPGFDSWDEIPLAVDMNCTRSSRWMAEVLKKSDEGVINGAYVAKLHKKLKHLSTYEDNRKYIDGLCEILRLNYREISKWDTNIRNNWLTDKRFIVNV